MKRGPGDTLKTNTAIALKLHAFGLTQLHDPNWTGLDLYYHIKEHLKGRIEPHDLLHKTLQKGLLYYMGEWLFEDFFFADIHRMALGDEYRFWYLEDLINLLLSADATPAQPTLQRARSLVEKTDSLYEKSESEYRKAFESKEIYEVIETLINTHEALLRNAMPDYAANYAERVFHDRQLCEHISRTVVFIGFPGTEDGEPKQWVERQSSWPSWAVKAVTARDQGRCAACGVSITLALDADPHIDHIVPLGKGGCNDLVNLQLLCSDCNLKKGTQRVDVESSIPPYLKLKRRPDKTED